MDAVSWSNVARDSIQAAWAAAVRYLPNIAGAAALLVLGWGLGRLARAWVSRLVARFDRWIPKRLLERGVGSGLVDRFASDLVGRIVFWIVFIFFVAAAVEALELPVATAGLARLSTYLPNVVAAAVVVAAGLVAGNLARGGIITAAGSAGLKYAEALGQGAKVVALLVAGVVAVDQLGIHSSLLIATLAIAIGSVVGAMGLAFGLGARTAVSNIIGTHQLVQLYRVGQHIRIRDVQGEVLEFHSMGVVLQAPEGRVFVPAKAFGESVSVGLAHVD